MANRTDGYISAAALALVLAMATIVGAVSFRGVSALRQAQRDLGKLQADYALAGAQERAMAMLAAGAADGRQIFAIPTDLGTATVLAEPERDKLRLADGVREADLAALGVADPHALAARLTALGSLFPSPALVGQLAAAPDWRACGPSLISGWGEAHEVDLGQFGSPGQRGAGSRLGQVWRLRARLGSGWTDERLVRFVGSDDLAAAVIWRSFKRQASAADLCVGKKAQSA
ncbi:hypothetical protein DMC25_00930 [Caulobacter sp. D4A]|uniref:hypothetical protein n=1 Tax=unclassified Caulobacter TaxID=2648921 RepID=UPI000D72B8C9|nr:MULTISPECIES: hypothetical protein [unclassified Caulobacter]PXA95301.1 hypothetical protein DMC25_00930 [Caulobacter sp. D4A]PXA95612.1 hypothetical protein DMC18_03570 [Caulobacter sp. D5]